MPHATTSLTSDEVDDLIYFSRAGDLDSLKDSISALSKTKSCTTASVLAAAIDVDEEGLGSGSCLLHYPAANGNLEVVTYLLSLVGGEPGEDAANQSKLVNHQNVSGNTPLHWAGMNGHLAVVQALVKAGADPEIVNSAGRDAVVESEWSSKDGAAECAVWILGECGALEKGIGEGLQEEGEGSERLGVDGEEEVDGNGDVSAEEGGSKA